jgi:two-component system, chemotaxis family, sensor kinase CheA
MDDIVKDFLIESSENLDRLDQELVQLENNPSSKELLGSIFRSIHSIKGSCGFLGFTRLQKLAHAGESLLARLRDGELQLSGEVTGGLLAMIDAVRQMLAAIEATGQDGSEDYSVLIQRLQDLQSATAIPPLPAQSQPRMGEPTPATEHSASSTDEELPDVSKLGGLLLQRGQVTAEDLARALQQQELGRKRLGEILIAQGSVRPEDVHSAQQIIASRNPEAAVQTIRIGVTLLDRLMNLVGELVLARNQLLQFAQRSSDTGFLSVSQRINLITGGLQEEVMKTRMQPIATVWNKFPRTVRDLAIACGKDVRLAMEGQNTELDRTILETIKDPLTHLVRNCVDHGIEFPEIRKQAGKAPAGTVKLRAFHEGGHVHVEISDDGAGLNVELIRQKALERGLATHRQAGHMPHRELLALIFQPGFSTAEKVTNLSGRGVGMDVVKTNVEKVGGTVDLQSTPGVGTTVKIKLPLTLAIIPALMVMSGGERFAIPQASLRELLRLESADGNRIEFVQGYPVYRLRGHLLPLLYLNRELNLPGATPNGTCGPANIVVVRADTHEFGIVVDEIGDTEEIVVKPLRRQLKQLTVYSGATIMGDGQVALILDVVGLAQRARIVSSPASALSAAADSSERREAEQQEHRLLLVGCGDSTVVGIPLSSVTRLEEFPVHSIEAAERQEVVQYRGEIMPIIRVAERLAAEPRSPIGNTPSVPIVVCSQAGRNVGLMVERILDIVDEKLELQSVAPRTGILGSSIVQGRVIDVLDVAGLVGKALPAFCQLSECATAGSSS